MASVAGVERPSDGQVLPHNQKPAATWGSAGREYDRISRRIADALEHCVLRLDPQPGERILDLATGTGWTSRLVARLGAAVIGADIAADLIAAARQCAQENGLPIEYRLGDAESLPFEDGQFDAVVSTFGIMFASRPEQAAAEVARVTCKGGRLALTTWLPDSNVAALFKIMKPYMPAPPVPAPPSPFDWGRPERIRELFGDWFDLGFERATSFHRERDGKAAWELFLTGYGPTKALAASLDEARRAELQRDFIAFHDGFATELGINVPKDYLLTIGTRR